MKRQIRVSVNGVHQFTIRVDQSEPPTDVAKRVRDVMALGDMVAHVSPGQINFGPRRS